MFSKWFGKREKTEGGREEAVIALKILDIAIMSIHPEKYATPLDAALELQPLRVSVNNVLGRPPEERFFPIEYPMFINQIDIYVSKGLIDQLIGLAQDEPVLQALIHGALHELRIIKNKSQHNSDNLGAEVQSSTKTLINFLNEGATRRLEPLPIRH